MDQKLVCLIVERIYDALGTVSNFCTTNLPIGSLKTQSPYNMFIYFLPDFSVAFLSVYIHYISSHVIYLYHHTNYIGYNYIALDLAAKKDYYVFTIIIKELSI